MSDTDGWVGPWRPHRPKGPIAALYKSPGPKYALPGLTGSVSHDLTKPKAPMFSFGTRREYNPKSSVGPSLIPSNVTRVGRDGAPSFSITSRPKDPQIFQTPGPGSYSVDGAGKCVFHSAPSFSLSGRSKEQRVIQAPGPASYTLPPVLGASAARISICGRPNTGGFQEDPNKSPGPAAYSVVNLNVYRKKAPHFSMAGVSPPENTSQIPGPGAHKPIDALTTARAPAFSFGLRHSEFIEYVHE